MDFFTRAKSRAHLLGRNISEVVRSANISINTYNTLKKNNNLLRADDALRIADELDTTVEWLVDGRSSLKVPERLHSIFEDLLILPSDDVEEVKSLVSIKADRIKKKRSGDYPVPEHSSA